MAFIDRGWQVVTIAEAGGSVRARHGLSVNVDHSFADAPPLDVLLVPGGQGTRQEVDNPRLIDFVREAGANAQYVTSVCTGAFILHRAGFLSGRRATTHWGAIGQLRDLGDVEVVDDERFVQDGNVITAAGVSARQSFANPYLGIDGLILLAQGLTSARALEKLIEGDRGRDLRQVAIVDRDGNTAAYTGDKCIPWAGHLEGGGYICLGNILAGEEVVKAMARAFEVSADEELPERLLRP